MDLRTLTITPDLLKLIAEIDEFKGSWTLAQTFSPERLQALRYVATIESIGSSTRIEGAKLSDQDVEDLLQGLEAKSFASRDEQEVAGYAQTMDMVFEHASDLVLSENYIKQLHRELLRHSLKDEYHRGEYKKFPNNVEAFDGAGESLGVVFETASPFDTPREMEELVKWTHETLEDESLHPLIVVGVFSVVFLAIHPFQDGNGRLSRILTTLLLLRAGYSYIPYASLESIIEKNKQAYYLALRRTQGTLKSEAVDWLPWLRFFLTALKRQKDHLAMKLKEHQALKAEGLPKESVRILDYVARKGRITTAEALELTGIPRPTVRFRLGQLVEAGFLELRGKGRGAHYVTPG
ncbi:MAG: AsnC family transcriptional regulator [Proteobacteria bacterium]|nr:MAG: AsnC family transcriptional regulator [Pseudomonadota bacterium]